MNEGKIEMGNSLKQVGSSISESNQPVLGTRQLYKP